MRKYIRFGLQKGYRILTSSFRFRKYAKNLDATPLKKDMITQGRSSLI